MLALAVLAVSTLLLLLACISDLKTTEVPDTVSIGLVAIIVAASIVHSVYSSDYSHLINTVAVGFAYFIVALAMFYLGQWGGGDVKILAGIGCVLGYLNSINYVWVNSEILPYYVVYFINMGLIAIPYFVVYSIVVGWGNGRLMAEFAAQTKRKAFLLTVVISFLPSLIALYAHLTSFIPIYLMLPLFAVLSTFLKVSEKVLFKRKVNPSELKVGDVLAEDLLVSGVKVVSSSNMEGLTEEQLTAIRKLEHLPDEVTVKLGVKFVPILLLAFLMTVFLGNPVEIAIFYFL